MASTLSPPRFGGHPGRWVSVFNLVGFRSPQGIDNQERCGAARGNRKALLLIARVEARKMIISAAGYDIAGWTGAVASRGAVDALTRRFGRGRASRPAAGGQSHRGAGKGRPTTRA